jgi:hypothetical protein
MIKKLAAILGVGAALLGGAMALAWTTSSFTFNGSISALLDGGSGVVATDVIQNSENGLGLGGVCTITTPGGTVLAEYAATFTQQVSNDGVNWASIDGGYFPQNGVTLGDAGPYQFAFQLQYAPTVYSRVLLPSGGYGSVSCTYAKP